MNENPLVSIILPTYNVKQYLTQCLDSVIGQTYDNIEIVIVIDGATDGSYDVAKEYAKKDSRVRVIWQENAGSGPARNNGLSQAAGEFAIFVDPDDYVDPNMVEVLLETIKKENVDLVLSGYRTFYENKSKESSCTSFSRSVLKSRSDARRKYLEYLASGLLGAPTRKLYKMSVIRDNDIEFPDLRRSQDIVFNYRYYNYVNSVCLIDKVFYHYRVDEQQYNLKLKKDYYKTLAHIYREVVQLCKEWDVGYTEKEYAEFCNFLLPSIISNIEANRRRGESIDQLIKDATVQEIVQRSTPRRKDQRLFKFAINRKYMFMLYLLVFLKKTVKRR